MLPLRLRALRSDSLLSRGERKPCRPRGLPRDTVQAKGSDSLQIFKLSLNFANILIQITIIDDTPKEVQLLNSFQCPEAHLVFWLQSALHSFFSMEAFPGLQGGRGYCRSLLPCMLRTRSGGCTYAFFSRQAERFIPFERRHSLH